MIARWKALARGSPTRLSVCSLTGGIARPASRSDVDISALTQLQRTQLGSPELVPGCDRCFRVVFGDCLNADWGVGRDRMPSLMQRGVLFVFLDTGGIPGEHELGGP